MSYQFHSDNLPAYRTEFDKLPNETSDEDLDQKLTILSLENRENEEVTLLPCGSQNEEYFCQFHVSTFQGQDLCRSRDLITNVDRGSDHLFSSQEYMVFDFSDQTAISLPGRPIATSKDRSQMGISC